MTKLAPCPTDIGIVLPLALTQLYFESLDLWPSGEPHGLSYSCAFEDCPAKIAKMAPDVQIKLTDMLVCDGGLSHTEIHAKRLVVASPSFLGEACVMTPVDLSPLSYATLCRSDRKCFNLKSSNGETVTIRPLKCFEGNDLFAAYEAAKQGIAYAVLPEWMVMDDIEAGRLIRLVPGWAPDCKRLEITISERCGNTLHASLLVGLMIEKMKCIPGIEVKS